MISSPFKGDHRKLLVILGEYLGSGTGQLLVDCGMGALRYREYSLYAKCHDINKNISILVSIAII